MENLKKRSRDPHLLCILNICGSIMPATLLKDTLLSWSIFPREW